MNQLFNPDIYQFNPHAIPMAIAGITVLATGIFILKQNPRSRTNISFFILCFSIFIWMSGFTLLYSITDPELALKIYRRYIFLGVSGIAPSTLFFSAAWLGFWDRQKKFIILSYLIFATFYFFAVTTSWVAEYIQTFYWGFCPKYGLVGDVFVAAYGLFFVPSFLNFMRCYLHPNSEIQKKQIGVTMIAVAIALTACVDFLTKLTGIPIYPFGYISVLLWILTVAYSIVRYRAMDIHTVIHKTILWITTSVIFLVPIAALAYFFHSFIQTLHPVVFGAFVFLYSALFIPYVRFIQPVVDGWFQRGRKNLIDALTRFAAELVQLKTLEELANHILYTIKRTIYPEDLQLLLWDEAKDECLVFASEGKVLKAGVQNDKDFFKFLTSFNSILISDFVGIDPRLEPVRENARAYFEETGAQVCVPIVLDDKLIGAINLTQKATLKKYSASEIRFLTDLRGAAAIAISNSLRLIAMQAQLRKWSEELEKQVEERTRELREAQGQLIQAEKLATIGTLAGGVAHEINNPLAAILTNAQMVLAENPAGDTKESVELIEEAAVRCREIVQKLMKYSRKSPQEEMTQLVSLNEVIENTISFLRYQLDQENITVSTDLKAKTQVKGNANELSQVFTNLIINARDAVQPKGKDGKVFIRTFEQNGKITAEVEDNGTGISDAHLPKVFDPFFTTKDVGKGTGLGLSIVQGIIQKHGANIDIKSKVNVGTTVSILFPK